MKALSQAIEIIGGQSRLAKILGVAPQVVHNWIVRGKGNVPVQYCAATEMATKGKITRRDLRPDDWHLIWPELVTDEHPAPVAAHEDRRTETSPPHVMAEKRKAGQEKTDARPVSLNELAATTETSPDCGSSEPRRGTERRQPEHRKADRRKEAA